jgi:hypothetical protein
MEIISHQIQGLQVAEIISDAILIQTAADGLDLLGNLYYQGFEKIVLRASNISPNFFDLKSGMAGEILQKFSNYRMQLAVLGDFSNHDSQALQAFIAESNRGRLVQFTSNLTEALNGLRA